MAGAKDRPRDPKTGRFISTGCAKKPARANAKTNLALKRLSEAVHSVSTISDPSAKLARMDKANEWADKAGKRRPYSATSIRHMQKRIIAKYD